MGNSSSSKYATNDEARVAIGYDTWSRLKTQLERYRGKSIDFDGFDKLIRSRFERMPKILVECLFQAFANNLQNKIELNDFLATLSIVSSQERGPFLKFLFRVYDVRQAGRLDRKDVEKLLSYAYGEKFKSSYSSIARHLDALFDLPQMLDNPSKDKSSISSGPIRPLTAKEFQVFEGRIDVLGGWIQAVLRSLLEPLSPKLQALDVKYSTAMEQDLMMSRYGVTSAVYMQLKHIFLDACGGIGVSRAELSLSSWLSWVQYILPTNIARIIFLSRVQSLKPVWRFSDFAEFVFLFGIGTVEDKFNATAKYLLASLATHWKYVNISAAVEDGCPVYYFSLKTIEEVTEQLERDTNSTLPCGNTLFFALLLFLGQNTDTGAVEPSIQSKYNPNDITSSNVIQNSSSNDSDNGIANDEKLDTRWLEEFLESISGVRLPGEVLAVVAEIIDSHGDDEGDKASADTSESDGLPSLADYASVVIQCHRLFPVIKALSTVACCIFGLRPPTPSLEKEYIMELLVKHYNDIPHSNSNPYGPAGSQWCVVSRSWYESWQFYVGNSRVRQMFAMQREQEMLRKQLKKQRKRGKKSKTVEQADAVASSPADAPVDINNSSLPMFRQYSEEDLPPEPGAIDNWSILNKTGPIQILPDSIVGQHLELVPMSIYKALYCWYGGGPRIIRNVILNSSGSNELELFPICLKVCTCDSATGTTEQHTKEYLFSKVATVQEVTISACQLLGLQLESTEEDVRNGGSNSNTLNDPSQTPVKPRRGGDSNSQESSSFESMSTARLWNIGPSRVSEQYILSPELTLQKAGVSDGQLVLVEVCINGKWPRSNFQEQYYREHGEDSDWNEVSSEATKETEVSDDRESSSSSRISNFTAMWSQKRPSLYEASQANSSIAKSSLATTTGPAKPVCSNHIQEFVRNDGKIGLDNLGNTCYLNSSLQALLHTGPLVEYFCKQYFVRDLNRKSKHGYGGRLAHAFGRLMFDLWTQPQPPSDGNNAESDANSGKNFRLKMRASKGAHINPRRFYLDFTALATQFRGHLQHDAQEVLAFLLDGLSEDLNLVTEKPYLEYPDSNDRPDKELADIWWKNHLMRDNSVIQALFAGQFKSVLSCECGYTSARFEPFMFLTLPLPEETTRPIVVYVMALANSFALKCCVRMSKDSTLEDVVTKLLSLNIAGITSQSRFKAGEVINSKVILLCPMTRRIGTIRDSDNIFLFECNPIPSESSKDNDSIQTTPLSSKVATESTEDVETDTLQENEKPSSIGSSEGSVDESDDHCSIVFVQRKATLTNGGGIKCYRMDSFGLPLVLVLDKSCSCRELYSHVAERVSRFLTAAIQDSLNVCQGFVVAKSNISSAAPVQAEAIVLRSESEGSEENFANVAKGSSAALTKGVHPVLTEDVLASNEIPQYGFSLRTISGHSTTNNVCSRCAWLAGCQGCLVPDDDTKIADFVGELTILSIDWHVVVFEELLDTNVASEVRNHESLTAEQARSMKKCVEFGSCLDKFTETEKLEDIMCPKCKTDTNMSKSLMLWRPPPVLVIQLKRFQYDRLSRRKLHEKVDFPIDNLDLAPYCKSDKISFEAEDFCLQYDLYAVVHHQGAMGEGHYVTTVRNLPVKQGQGDSSKHDEEWTCYNDGFISPIKTEDIVANASAYVLFYMRKDVQGMSIDQLFHSDKPMVQIGSRKSDDKEGTREKESDPKTPTKHRPARESGDAKGPDAGSEGGCVLQ